MYYDTFQNVWDLTELGKIFLIVFGINTRMLTKNTIPIPKKKSIQVEYLECLEY